MMSTHRILVPATSIVPVGRAVRFPFSSGPNFIWTTARMTVAIPIVARTIAKNPCPTIGRMIP